MRNVIIGGSVSLCLLIVGCAAKPPHARTSAAPGAAATATTPDPRNKVIVHIVSQHQTITVTSSPGGLLYSLKDPNGRVQLADATEARFSESHPAMFQQLKHYIAVHADDAPILSAGIDAPSPSATPRVNDGHRSFRGPLSGVSSDDFKRTAGQPFPDARAPE